MVARAFLLVASFGICLDAKAQGPYFKPSNPVPGSSSKYDVPNTYPQYQVPEIHRSLKGILGGMLTPFGDQYALQAWNKIHNGWTLDAAYAQAMAKVPYVKTTEQARKVVMDFIYSMKDYHVSVSFTETATATLGFTVKSVAGRTFIEYIDRTQLPQNTFNFNVGDEVVLFNGKPIARALKEIQNVVAANKPATDAAGADIILTSRKAADGYPTPKTKTTIQVGIERRGSSTVETVSLQWNGTKESVRAFSGKNRFRRKMNVIRANYSPAEPRAEGNAFTVGARSSYMPALGTKIWSSPATNFFDAYVYNNAKGEAIGVVRIGQYNDNSGNYDSDVNDFKTIIQQFNAMNVKGMVIDQMDNPGGSVFFMYELLSMLAIPNYPLFAPLSEMSVLPPDVEDAQNDLNNLKQGYANGKTLAAAQAVLGTDWDGFPVTLTVADSYQQYAQFLVNSWKSDYVLTPAHNMNGVSQIIADSSDTFTGPILVVVNELCFSGGDFFPAILQDNARAKIFGAPTAGAGGFVDEYEEPENVIGVDSYRVTTSIAERRDRNAIENLGVTPDVAYSLTLNDLQNGFQDYKNAIAKAIDEMVGRP